MIWEKKSDRRVRGGRVCDSLGPQEDPLVVWTVKRVRGTLWEGPTSPGVNWSKIAGQLAHTRSTSPEEGQLKGSTGPHRGPGPGGRSARTRYYIRSGCQLPRCPPPPSQASVPVPVPSIDVPGGPRPRGTGTGTLVARESPQDRQEVAGSTSPTPSA